MGNTISIWVTLSGRSLYYEHMENRRSKARLEIPVAGRPTMIREILMKSGRGEVT